VQWFVSELFENDISKVEVHVWSELSKPWPNYIKKFLLTFPPNRTLINFLRRQARTKTTPNAMAKATPVPIATGTMKSQRTASLPCIQCKQK
jgi:hypothetical protein